MIGREKLKKQEDNHCIQKVLVLCKKNVWIYSEKIIRQSNKYKIKINSKLDN